MLGRGEISAVEVERAANVGGGCGMTEQEHLAAIARHESAHAVAARLLGVQVVRVSADPCRPRTTTRYRGIDEPAMLSGWR